MSLRKVTQAFDEYLQKTVMHRQLHRKSHIVTLLD